MARIRTIKPDFFRHEALQDLEAANPGQHVMLVFAALWGHCDKEGRFLWRPRSLKLDILPFLDFDLGASLMLLWEAGQVERYEIDGVEYGFVPTFKEHQRISGKEVQEPAKHPSPQEFFPRASQGSGGEATGKQSGSQEGKGREKEGKGISLSADADRERDDAEFEQLWQQWHWHKTPKGSKKAALDEWNRNVRKPGHDPGPIIAAAMAYCAQCRRTDTSTQHVERWLKKQRWQDDYGATFFAPNGKNGAAPQAPAWHYGLDPDTIARREQILCGCSSVEQMDRWEKSWTNEAEQRRARAS